MGTCGNSTVWKGPESSSDGIVGTQEASVEPCWERGSRHLDMPITL